MESHSPHVTHAHAFAYHNNVEFVVAAVGSTERMTRSVPVSAPATESPARRLLVESVKVLLLLPQVLLLLLRMTAD